MQSHDSERGTETDSEVTKVAPEQDPVTARARMTVEEYQRSKYFSEDYKGLSGGIVVGVVGLALLSAFSVPWQPPQSLFELATLADVLELIVSYGALPIFLLAFVAVKHARRSLAELGVNMAIVRHVERGAAQRLREIRQDPSLRGAVSRLESEYLPDNSDDPKPASLRLFQRICREAMDRRFESTINLIEPYQRESVESTLKLEGVQKTALRLGILCHFIGLVLVINAVPAVLAGAEASLPSPAQALAVPGVPAEAAAPGGGDQGAIATILDGLRLAFGASVGGLSVSIFAAGLLAVVRRNQFRYFRGLDETTATMISLASNSMNNDELLASLSHVSHRLQEQTQVVKEGIGVLADSIGKQAGTIKAGLDQLGGAKADLDRFLSDVAASHQAFLERLNTFYDVRAMADVVAEIQRDLAALHAESHRVVKSEAKGLRAEVAGVQEMATLHLGRGTFQYLPHALIGLAVAQTATLLLLLWR